MALSLAYPQGQYGMPMITALAGGVGAARLLTGLAHVVAPEQISAIVNTGDDMVLHGLHISPDIDTLTYSLAGAGNSHTGWGLAGETWHVMDALERYGGETWFRLGDRDLATHLYRTQRLRTGATLTQVTSEIARSWAVSTRLLPMSDDPVRTQITLASGEQVEFQHYFVRLRHDVAVSDVRFTGATEARPTPQALQALNEAETVIICPSNPVVSIGPILAVPSYASVLANRRESVVAVSPIVAGAAIKGPAAHMMAELGHEPSVVGVARLYARLAATLLIDESDAALAGQVEACGMRCVVAPAVMSSPALAAGLASRALEAVRSPV